MLSPQTDSAPITRYAENRAKWEESQLRYQYGRLFIIPPAHVQDSITPLREAYDPQAHAILDAHISLSVPFPREVSESDWRSLRQVLSSQKPFTISYGPVYRFPESPIVVLRIEPVEHLRDLVSRIEQAPCFRGAADRLHRFTPHMTIAQHLSLEEGKRLCSQLSGKIELGTFECSHLSYAVPDEDFRYTKRRELKL